MVKHLEKQKDNAYGYDVWVKRTNKMVLNERYKRADYHTDMATEWTIIMLVLH